MKKRKKKVLEHEVFGSSEWKTFQPAVAVLFFFSTLKRKCGKFVIFIDRFSCDGGGNPNKTFGKALVAGFYKYQFLPIFIFIF